MSIRSETGQDGSITDRGRALQHFTNRRRSIRHFAEYLNDDPAKGKILFFHGDGGNGKTLLLRFLQERCCKRLHGDNWEHVKSLEGDDFVENFAGAVGCAEVPSSLIDFSIKPHGEYRPKEAFSALMKLRRDLSGSGLRFPLYDFACTLYLHKAGRLTRERLKDLFPQEAMDFVAESVNLINRVPGAGLAKAVLGLFNTGLRDKFTLYMSARKVGEEQVRELQRMDPESDLYGMFPVLFAEDLNASMTLQDAHQRIVLFFDAHEAFWGVSERRFSDEKYFIADEWLRRVLCSLEFGKGIVAVVAGREEPRWAEATKETISTQNVDTHLVGGLSSADAAIYLEKVGIENGEMNESLLAYAQIRSDEVHPLYLGFCADIVLAARKRGKEIEVEEFREVPDAALKGKELMNRLCAYVDRQTEYAMRALSACRSFDRDLYEILMETMKLGFSRDSFDYLTQFSFVWDSEKRNVGWYRIHDLMRRLTYEQKDEVTRKAHQHLAQYYGSRGEQGDIAAISEKVYHTSRLDAADGLSQWLSEMERALSLSKYDLCRALIEIRTEMSFPDAFDRGQVSAKEGDYYASLSIHENALIEYQEAIAAYDEALRRAPDDGEAHNNKGNALRSLGDLQAGLAQHLEATKSYALAIAAFDEALRRAPDSVGAHNNKGIALHSLGDLQTRLAQHEEATKGYALAIAAFDEALRRGPDSVGAHHNNKGNALQSLGDQQAGLARHEGATKSYAQAIAAYDEALRREPDDVGARNNKGVTLQRLGDLQAGLAQQERATKSYALAIAAFDETLCRAPDSIGAHSNKGIALHSLGDLQTRLAQYEEATKSFALAIAAFDEALRRAPDDVRAHNNKGIALQGLGYLQARLAQHDGASKSYSRAIAACDEALLRAPDSIGAHSNKGNALQSLGDLQARLAQYEEATKSYAQAIATYDEALRRAPDDVGAHNNKGNALRSLGDLQAGLSQHEHATKNYTQATAAFDEALRRAPDYVGAFNNKGNALRCLGDLQAGLAQQEEATKSYTLAIAAFDEALRRAPDYVDAHNNKGNALQRLGDLQARLAQHEAAKSYALAIVAYDEALRRAPDDVGAHNNKGLALQRLGDLRARLAQHEEAMKSYALAIAAYDEALRRAPDYVQIHNNMGLALQKLGDLQAGLAQHEEAMKSYAQAIASFSKSLEIAPAQTKIRELLDWLQQMIAN